VQENPEPEPNTMNELLFLILVPLTLLLVLRRKRTDNPDDYYGEDANPEPCNMDEDGVGCKPQDNDR
jgi:hypothetical protein